MERHFERVDDTKAVVVVRREVEYTKDILLFHLVTSKISTFFYGKIT